MSKGTRIYTLRIPQDLMDEVGFLVGRSVFTKKGEPHTRTSWIIQAIREKLDHVQRSKKPRKSKAKGCNTPPENASIKDMGKLIGYVAGDE